jgi:hypothetical protein
MATADQQVAAGFNGVDPDTGNTVSWANAKLRMRTTLSNILSKAPFSYQFSRWDQFTTTAEQIASCGIRNLLTSCALSTSRMVCRH